MKKDTDLEPRKGAEALEKKVLHGQLERKLQDSYRKYPWMDGTPQEITAEALTLVADTLLQTSKILTIPIPPVEFFLDYGLEEDITLLAVQGRSQTGSLKLKIELNYFLDLAERLKHAPTEEITHIIKEDFGEEMYHVFVEKNFPTTDKVTKMANEIGGNAYLHDRGERAAKGFGKRFAEGTLPPRRLAKAG